MTQVPLVRRRSLMETLWVESEAPEARPVFPPSSLFSFLANVSMAALLWSAPRCPVLHRTSAQMPDSHIDQKDWISGSHAEQRKRCTSQLLKFSCTDIWVINITDFHIKLVILHQVLQRKINQPTHIQAINSVESHGKEIKRTEMESEVRQGDMMRFKSTPSCTSCINKMSNMTINCGGIIKSLTSIRKGNCN